MKLSVAMCTYNGEKYIKEQIESILRQTTAIDEIIICDDASKDKTIQIIKEIQLYFPDRISLFINEVTLGSNKNFEKAITLCSGDYIFLSDQDDVWKDNKAEKIISSFDKNESLEGVFSNADLINDKNEVFTENSLWDTFFFLEKQLQKPLNLFCLIRSHRNMVTGATLCFKKEIKKYILPIPDSKKYYHDEWIAILIASRNKLSYTNENLISYRIHSNQQVGGKGKSQKKAVKKHLKLSNAVLGNSAPESYQDFKQLAKTYHLNYLKFQKIDDTIKKKSIIDFKAIANTNLDLFLKCNESQKKINPILYTFESIIDKIRGKRQFKQDR